MNYIVIFKSVTFHVPLPALTCPLVCPWSSFTLINLYNLLLSALSSAIADNLRGEKHVSFSTKICSENKKA